MVKFLGLLMEFEYLCENSGKKCTIGQQTSLLYFQFKVLLV